MGDLIIKILDVVLSIAAYVATFVLGSWVFGFYFAKGLMRALPGLGA